MFAEDVFSQFYFYINEILTLTNNAKIQFFISAVSYIKIVLAQKLQITIPVVSWIIE